MRSSIWIEVSCRGTDRTNTFRYWTMSWMTLWVRAYRISSSSATLSIVIRWHALIMPSIILTFSSVAAVQVRPGLGISETCWQHSHGIGGTILVPFVTTLHSSIDYHPVIMNFCFPYLNRSFIAGQPLTILPLITYSKRTFFPHLPEWEPRQFFAQALRQRHLLHLGGTIPNGVCLSNRGLVSPIAFRFPG